MGMKQLLILREEQILGMFENRVQRRRYGPQRGEGVGDWRKLHNEVFIICTIRQVLLL
jgi:hypothetical protein